MSIADQLSKLNELKQSGALTDAEFAEQKENILSKSNPIGSSRKIGILAIKDAFFSTVLYYSFVLFLVIITNLLNIYIFNNNNVIFGFRQFDLYRYYPGGPDGTVNLIVFFSSAIVVFSSIIFDRSKFKLSIFSILLWAIYATISMVIFCSMVDAVAYYFLTDYSFSASRIPNQWLGRLVGYYGEYIIYPLTAVVLFAVRAFVNRNQILYEK